MSDTKNYILNISEALEEMEILTESSISRVYSQNKNKNFGTITAWRGVNGDVRNAERNKKLKGMIHAAGYGVVNLHGRYEETDTAGNKSHVREHAFGVISPHEGDDGGRLLNHMKAWGAYFGQDTILHKSHDTDDAYLHATNKTSWVHNEPEGKFKVGKFTPNVTNPNGDSSLKGHSFAYLNDNKPDSDEYRPQETTKLGKTYPNTKK